MGPAVVQLAHRDHSESVFGMLEIDMGPVYSRRIRVIGMSLPVEVPRNCLP